MRIAVIGFGSVGRGVAEAVEASDNGLIVTAVADSRSAVMDASGLDIAEIMKNKKATGMCGSPDITVSDIISSDVYDILVEVSPTNADTGEPALGYIREALSSGRHVATSNKGPVALKYDELNTIAEKNNVSLRYEATVCGAIPLIHTIEHGIAGNVISRLYGIFNGTCNYILTRMAEEGLTYQQALLEARELGYAEADPTYDVQGIDAAIKLVILANAVWGMKTSLDDVDIIGIDRVTSAAIALAEKEDQTIRLIGEIDPRNNIIRVSPSIIPKSHPLVVQDTLNAVTIETSLAGDITLIGKGAGSSETASAILSDLLFICDCYGRRD